MQLFHLKQLGSQYYSWEMSRFRTSSLTTRGLRSLRGPGGGHSNFMPAKSDAKQILVPQEVNWDMECYCSSTIIVIQGGLRGKPEKLWTVQQFFHFLWFMLKNEIRRSQRKFHQKFMSITADRKNIKTSFKNIISRLYPWFYSIYLPNWLHLDVFEISIYSNSQKTEHKRKIKTQK